VNVGAQIVQDPVPTAQAVHDTGQSLQTFEPKNYDAPQGEHQPVAF